MRIVYTPAALRDLDQIAEWLALHYPTIAPVVEIRIRAVVARIGQWPESARRSAERSGVRVVPVGRYTLTGSFIGSRQMLWKFFTFITRRANLGSRANSEPVASVGLAKAREHRAHAVCRRKLHPRGHASLCPPLL
jgi:plasmid stabilization system protein ParE